MRYGRVVEEAQARLQCITAVLRRVRHARLEVVVDAANLLLRCEAAAGCDVEEGPFS